MTCYLPWEKLLLLECLWVAPLNYSSGCNFLQEITGHICFVPGKYPILSVPNECMYYKKTVIHYYPLQELLLLLFMDSRMGCTDLVWETILFNTMSSCTNCSKYGTARSFCINAYFLLNHMLEQPALYCLLQL